jgi:CheY-like chemotaxis protein
MARLLLIEDDDANARLACFVLEHAAHEVFRAADALSGIALAQTAAPDLVLLDIRLPGMDGIEAVRRLKKDPRTAHLPVIALTAQAMPGDEELCREGGCDAYLSKPYEYRWLLAEVDRVLRSRSTSS